MEEYLLTEAGLQEQILFFYVNAPSIIIGRHQNTLEEINREYVQNRNIQVVRRCSGGGAVYHDLGNLNYSLIIPGDPGASSDFSVLLQPILGALREMGLDAELSGRNDLTYRGAKFSGNAYYHNRSGSVIHGTLLFDSDLEVLGKALNPNPLKLKSKGVQSVRSRVCCIKNALPGIRNTTELEQAIVRHFALQNDLHLQYFTPEDISKIEQLAEKRYRNDSWTYGESPAYNVRRTLHAPSGWIDFRAQIQDDTIQTARFFGDFFCSGDIKEAEASLQACPWTEENIRQALLNGKWDELNLGISARELTELLLRHSANA